MHPRHLAFALALDLAVVAAVTILGALHVLPSEAVVGLLGAFVGAAARHLHGGSNGPPTSGAGSLQATPSTRRERTNLIARVLDASCVAVILTLVFPFLSHPRGSEV